MRKTNSGQQFCQFLRLAFAVCAVLMLGISAAQAAPITVSSNADGGPGTLREAITASNASAGTFDTITFSGVTTIALTTPLPAITDPVMIDGGATPTVELNGLGTQNAAGNSSIGLWIRAGGTTVRGMVINRFAEAGIRMDTDMIGTDTGNTIIGNRIGTNIAGATVLANFNRGILIVGTTGHNIGDGTTAGRNQISGNSGRGVEITAGGASTIRGNLIGTNAAGTGDLGNSEHGVWIVFSSNSVVGGTAAGDRNVISGNNANGVSIIADIGQPAANNIVQGNYIGVDSAGNTELANNGSGVVVQAANNLIGSTSGGGGRNIISGNASSGISVSTTLATGNTIAGNAIGVGANGTTAVANTNDGVRISSQASNNIIGGNTAPGMCNNSCNIIANNGAVTATTARAGIYVDPTSSTGNRIRGNSVFGNFGIGIDLGTSGATANDMNDVDTGANGLQNKPVITTAFDGGGIMGTLNSTPSTSFTIDFYRNDATDTQGMSEGRTYVGSSNMTTDASGNGTFNTQAGAVLALGQFITATATRSDAPFDTSEISDAVAVTDGPAGPSGIECDVFPRENPDGVVDSLDVGQVRRFQLGFDNPYLATEFQRADCALASSRGDGFLDSLDVGQAQRYQLTLDQSQVAGGPTDPASLTSGNTKTETKKSVNADADQLRSAQNSEKDEVMAPREVRVVNQTTTAGATITVVLETDAMGDESIYGFSLNYSTSILTYVPNSVTIGSGATRQAGGMCNVLENAMTAGQIGFSVDCNNSTITAGNNRRFVTLQFTVASNAAVGSTPLTFGDVPAIRRVSSNPASGPIMDLPTTFTNGSISIVSPTREVRVVSQNTTPGSTITVVLEADAFGDESIYGFSLNYVTTVLTYVPNSVMIGSGATRQAGGMCNVLENAMTAGQIGFSVECSNSTITAGNNRPLVTLQFTVASNAPTGSTPLTFGDAPAIRSVSSNPQAGPIRALPTTFTNGTVNIGSNRVVRVLSQDSSRNSTITVVLEADTMGDESIYGFSLNYNSAILTYVPNSIMIGSGATRQAGGLCNVLENANTVGRIGFSVDCNNSTITMGNNRRFVTLQFTVASNAPVGQTPLEFANVPARQSVSSNPQAGPIRALPTVFVDGVVNILTPTAASVSVSGKISTAQGGTIERTAIYLTDGTGRTRRVVTNSFGFYRFDEVAAGETYTVSVSHKEYQFEARIITVNEAVENLDFTAQP